MTTEADIDFSSPPQVDKQRTRTRVLAPIVAHAQSGPALSAPDWASTYRRHDQ